MFVWLVKHMAELTSQQRTPLVGRAHPDTQSWSVVQWTLHTAAPLLEPLPPPLLEPPPEPPPLDEPEPLLEPTVLSSGASYNDPLLPPPSSPNPTVESPDPQAVTLPAAKTKATLVQSNATLMGTPFLCE